LPALSVTRETVETPRWKHLLLFVLTLLSMTTAGAMQQGVNPFSGVASIVHLVEGIPFAATLLGILGVHEFGHYFAARRCGVKASLPYFLPLPYISIIGTLGAVIRIRSPIPHKRALLDIGAAGPLPGLAVAIIACAVGLAQSTVVETGYFQMYPVQLGAPLLFEGLSLLMLPEVGSGQLVLLNPIAFAGWVGLFITALNLLPVGQLDGGHIAYALFGRHFRHLARVTFVSLLAMSSYNILRWGWAQSPVWLVLAFILVMLGTDHPPPRDPVPTLGPGRKFVGILCLLTFVACFTPVPFRL
jgi:membrane-associated protease RseP (regulator of RpoE activity)